MYLRDLLRCLLLFCFAGLASAQEIPFTHVVIDADGPLNPWGKSFGDLNGNGKQDLIVGGSKSGGLVWYENGTWKKHFIAAEGRWSTDHEAVDVDNDGDIDVVALTTSAICWLENPGWKRHEVERRVLHDVEVADFDGDGDLDLVGRDQGEFGHRGDSLHFYRQEPGDKWTHLSTPCPNGEGLRVADIDGDGDTDVALNAVWLQNTGKLEPAAWKQHRYAEQWIHDATFVAISDVNLDGRADIVLSPSELAGQAYRVSWFEAPNNRTKTWTEHVVLPQVESVHHFVGAADFDLDGDIDIATAAMHQGRDPDNVQVLVNQGDCETWTSQILSTQGSHSMRILDVDGDGDSDLFGANHAGTQVDLWINESKTTGSVPNVNWKRIQIDDARVGKSFGIATGDLNGDGAIDIAAGNYAYVNSGHSVEGKWRRVLLSNDPSDPVDANAVLDIDGDKFADILAQRLPDLVWLEYQDDPKPGFVEKVVATGLKATGHRSSQGFALGDLTGNGRSEFVFTAGDGIHFAIQPKEIGKASWPVKHVAKSAPEEGIAIGDVDSDGALDIISWYGAGSGSNELGWWRNPVENGALEGDWLYSKIGEVEGSEGDRIEVGDFNHDGVIDVAATGTSNRAKGSFVYWFENLQARRNNNAKLNWKRHVVAADVGAMNSLSVADMDRDGIDDIITSEHRGAKKTTVWRNQGYGEGWQEQLVDQGVESHLGARVADLDGDGDLDIMTTGWDDSNTFYLWKNN